ncbi:MAG: hypothetical protein DDT26_00316 [Dehalococcoidia bacterium]|nr:hypothetical protein [Chloroflexota bacterium]
MKFVGIDYSMNSPAICLHDKTAGSVEFHYLTTTKKYEGVFKFSNGWECTGHTLDCGPSWSSDQERFSAISGWALWVIRTRLFGKPTSITIEGYAMGSKGLVFNIAENTGLLKYKLWLGDYKFNIAAPSAIKKLATGKGNANKEAMDEAFTLETKINVKATLGASASSWNPSSDIIDAYYMMRYSELVYSTSK